MSEGGSTDRDTSQNPEDWQAVVRRFEGRGMPLRAYDAAMRGLEHDPDNLWLKHRAVLALARSGATEVAARRFREFGLEDYADEDIAALGARLDKDLAWLSEGDERRQRAAVAAESYARVYDRTGGYFPGINAATMRLVAGDQKEARDRARRILEEIARLPAADGMEGYYREATIAESWAILGDQEAAKAALRRANAFLDSDLAAQATTRKQIRQVCQVLDLDGAILDELAPPRIIHHCGHMIAPAGEPGRFIADGEDGVAARIRSHLEEFDIAIAYGSLACGSDILFAEAMTERRGEFNVVLPFRVEEFIETSVRPGGTAWIDRFQRCLGEAASVSFATEGSYLEDDQLFAYASRMAMGLALLRARYLDGSVEQVAVWDGQPAHAEAGTAVDVYFWRGLGLRQTVIPSPARSGRKISSKIERAARPIGRMNRAMLFGDVKGFSKLDDRQLPLFVRHVLGTMARVLDGYGKAVLFRNTWGDGIYLVFDDVMQAARCAVELQAAISDLPRSRLGLPDGLGFRLGGHFGPVYEDADPITGATNFFGAHVSRAARIEPITPEGCVYVSEPFAAAIALDPSCEFDCDYVGTIPSAKDYGEFPMYLLRKHLVQSYR